MKRRVSGFTLIELIAIIVILGIIGITVSSRFTDGDIASVQTSRDDLVAALFFAQQTAMARDNIQLVVTGSSVDVRENGSSIDTVVEYPLAFADGVQATPQVFSYDKLGRTTAASITLILNGASATVNVSDSGYAY